MYESLSTGSLSTGSHDYPRTQEASEVSSRISQEMSAIYSGLGEMSDVCGLFEMRLNAIMRPAPETPQSGGGKDAQVSSPMSGDLKSFNLQINSTLSRYRSILERLEI